MGFNIATGPQIDQALQFLLMLMQNVKVGGISVYDMVHGYQLFEAAFLVIGAAIAAFTRWRGSE